MKIKLDYDALMEKAAEKKIYRMSKLCKAAGVNYFSLLNGKSKDQGISIENAWLLSEYLECSINLIVKPDWTS